MYRVAIEESQAEPFATPAETEKAHIALIERMRAAEAMAGEAGPPDGESLDTGPADTLAALHDDIALFEARLVATGVRLPDSSNRRVLAQSMLDFWALRQSDLSVLAMRLAPPSAQEVTMRPELPTAKLLAPYDPTTASDAAARAEACYAALPGEDIRMAARRGFLALLQPEAVLDPAEVAALTPFAAARVLSRQPADQPGPGFGIVHEELPRAWARLAEWQEDDAHARSELERFRSNAEAWSKSGSAAELPRGDSLVTISELAERDETLLPYVQAAEERSRSQRKIIYGIIAAMVLVVILAATSGGYLGRMMGETTAVRDGKESGEELAAAKQTAEQQVVIADAPQQDGADTAAGSTGWIWLGSTKIPQVVLADGSAADPASLLEAGAKLRTRANLKIRSARPGADNIAGKRIGQVSGDVVVELLGPATSVAVGGTEQYWAEVRVIPAVYIQIAKGADLPLDRLRTALARAGFAVQPEQELPNLAQINAPLPFDVRYYYEQDVKAARATAAIVARALGAPAPRADEGLIPLVGSPLAERVKTGTIEVWIYAR